MPQNQPNHPVKRRTWLWWLLASPFILVLVLMIAFYFYVDHREFTMFINPLPKDEKMIAHFQAHRNEFETLVKYFQLGDINYFNDLPENKALMKTAAIHRLKDIGSTWFPNPYSAESAKEFEIKSEHASAEKKGLEFIHPYKSIRFEMEDQPLGRSNRSAQLSPIKFWANMISKEYMYIPEIPKIEDGRLWYPVTSSGRSTGSARAYKSLDGYPFGWERGECVYRQFEPHWLLVMCIII